MRRSVKVGGFDFEHAGFSAFSGPPDPALAHRHNEVELAVFEGAPLLALYGGRQVTVAPDRLVVFWGAMPHRALRLLGPTVGHGLRIPLSWVLQWNLPEALLRRLLSLEVTLAATRRAPCSDLALVKDWVGLMRDGQVASREAVLLEVRARLLRLALEAGRSPRDRGTGRTSVPAGGESRLFERILKVVTERYREPLTIPGLASELGVSRTHAMRCFRKVTHMTLLEYITQRRVSHAQRLLTTTDMKTLEVAYESGFQSPARFYACFRRLVGQTPARYRRSI